MIEDAKRIAAQLFDPATAENIVSFIENPSRYEELQLRFPPELFEMTSSVELTMMDVDQVESDFDF